MTTIPETTEAMLARVRASIARQTMMTTLGVELIAAFAVMQATMTALYGRPDLSG